MEKKMCNAINNQRCLTSGYLQCCTFFSIFGLGVGIKSWFQLLCFLFTPKHRVFLSLYCVKISFYRLQLLCFLVQLNTFPFICTLKYETVQEQLPKEIDFPVSCQINLTSISLFLWSLAMILYLNRCYQIDVESSGK